MFKLIYLRPRRRLTQLVVYRASLHPLGAHMAPTWCPVASQFYNLTMGIIPTQISHHRGLAGEHSHIQSYTTHKAEFCCNGEFALKNFIERDNTS